MNEEYKHLLQWFGSKICWMKKMHYWSRAYDQKVGSIGRFKKCARCGLVQAVKRRKKEAK